MEEKAVCRMVEVHKLLYFIPVKFNFIYNNAKPQQQSPQGTLYCRVKPLL